jgi:hypothetical protein
VPLVLTVGLALLLAADGGAPDASAASGRDEACEKLSGSRFAVTPRPGRGHDDVSLPLLVELLFEAEPGSGGRRGIVEASSHEFLGHYRYACEAGRFAFAAEGATRSAVLDLRWMAFELMGYRYALGRPTAPIPAQLLGEFHLHDSFMNLLVRADRTVRLFTYQCDTCHETEGWWTWDGAFLGFYAFADAPLLAWPVQQAFPLAPPDGGRRGMVEWNREIAKVQLWSLSDGTLRAQGLATGSKRLLPTSFEQAWEKGLSCAVCGGPTGPTGSEPCTGPPPAPHCGKRDSADGGT